MNQNTSSPGSGAAGPSEPAGPGGLPVGLEGLAAAVAELLDSDPDSLGDALLATQVLAMRRLADQLDAAWLRRLAALDARGAAGADHGTSAPSTAGWLRASLRMSPAAATQRVRTARALHRGPLHATAHALAHGQVSYQHAATLADATADLPAARVAEAEPVLVEAAGRLDPGRLRRLAAHLREVIDPDTAEQRAQARLDRRGLWLATTFDGLVAVDGLLDGEAGEAVQAALAPLARPAGPDDERSAAQRRADALGELARQGLQAGRLPQAGGLRPQLTVTIELASLLATHGSDISWIGISGDPSGLGGVGGVGGWGGTLQAEAVRRLACDAAVTRAVVHRHPTNTTGHTTTYDGDGGLATRLRDAMALLPAPLGAPTELLDLGRTTRVVTPALRRALALRDGGCAAPGCDRPASWTDAHHLVHWLHGGPTNLDNLVLLCRTHHRAVHEHRWRLGRDPTSGRITLAPPVRRGHPPAA